MPITPTYPGIYIDELPSSSHTIVAAPTSITVFIGYSHPFKSGFDMADSQDRIKVKQIFSFSEYERLFGGFFSSGYIAQHLPVAVNQFFLNGGSNAYIVALRPAYVSPVGGAEIAVPATPVARTTPDGIRFTALEPVDQVEMKVEIIASADKSAADIRVTYGSRFEMFRNVSLTSNDPNTVDKKNARYIETVIGTAAKPVSSLVTVDPDAAYPAQFASQTVSLSGLPQAGVIRAFNAADFTAAFADEGLLDKVPIFNLMSIPGIADTPIWSSALAFCEKKRAFLIMDPPADRVADSNSAKSIYSFKVGPAFPVSVNGALYFPFLKSTNPLTNQPMRVPPSGYVAGLYAKTDQNRGVWKAPAGLETGLLNTTGVVDEGCMNDMQHGKLNQVAVNCLRSFPGSGTVIFGARTIKGGDLDTAFQQWKYVPVRRMALFLEQTLFRNLQWVVFEPNDEPLWVAIRSSIERFMLSLFRQGAFQGLKPSDAFQVKCDSSTTTQDDIDNGIVNIIVAFAPLKPAEFVIVKIAQLAGQAQA